MPAAFVRPATADDAGPIAGLLVRGSREPDAEDPAREWRYAAAIDRVRARGGEVLVATLDGEVVGCCQVGVVEHVQHAGGRACELESVHVDEGRRNAGIGRALVEAAVEWGVARGCYRAQLTSHVSRTDAHRFYERCGFAPTHVGFKRPL